MSFLLSIQTGGQMGWVGQNYECDEVETKEWGLGGGGGGNSNQYSHFMHYVVGFVTIFSSTVLDCTEL